MIPDFKTFIKESVWADIHKRSSGSQIRKEDATNINSIKPVDIGASVLWADRDLEKQGEYLFAFDEIQIDSNEWRLPTKEEIDELELKFFGKAVEVYHSENSYSLQYIKSNMKITLEDGSLIYRDGDVELVFEARGSVFPGYTNVDYVGEFYDGWGDDNNVDTGYENCAYYYPFGKESFKLGLCSIHGKNCVRLVKDK